MAKQFGAWRRFNPLHAKRHTFVIDTNREVLAVVESELKFTVHADEALEVLRARVWTAMPAPRGAGPASISRRPR